MVLQNTPPYSPQRLLEEETDENIVMNDNEAFEVIDLDEVLEGGEMGDEEIGGDEEEGASSSLVQIEDNSSIKFGGHGNKSVFCVDLRPGDRSSEAVSGGEDDKAFIWDTQSGEVKFVCDGFKDSVTHARFNHDGSYLAVADMSGVIRVYKMANFTVVWEFETNDVTWMEWHIATNVLLAGTVDSECWMWKIPSGDSKIYMGNGERVDSAVLLPDGKRIAIGYGGGGTVKVFDLKTGDVQINSHNEGLSSISCIDANTGFIGYGSVNGLAKVMALQSAKVIGTFSHGRSGSSQEEVEMEDGSEPVDNSIECIAFSKHRTGTQYLYTAALNGELNVWDLSTQVARHSSILGSGIVKVLVRNKNPSHLLVATLDGVVIVYDSLTGEVLGSCTGHTAAILDIQQSRDGCTLISSSDDGYSRIFDLTKIINTSA